MSTEVTLFKNGVPAHLKNQELNDVTKALLGGGGGQNKRISIRGNVFRLVVNGKEIAVNEDRSMNVVIINVAPKVSRAYYEGTYVADAKVSPACWSADGDRPDKSIKEPQNSACATCPQNVKGSGDNNTRKCKFSRMLAVVLENDMGGDLFQLSLPSQSIFGKGEDGKLPLNAYAQFLAGFNVNVTAVVTEMKFDINSATPKLFFKAVRPLTAEEYEICSARTVSEEAVEAVTVSFQPPKAEPDAPAAAAPAKPKSLAAPVEEPDEDEPVAAEPKKRESKKDAAPAPKKDLAKVLENWDDED